MNRLAAVSRRGGGRNCFFVFRKGEEDGPFSLDQLEELHRKGDVPAATPCRSEKDREWHDLGFILRVTAEEAEEESVSGTLGDAAGGESKAFSGVGNREEPLMEKHRSRRAGREEGMRELVLELVEAARRQNRLLSAIRWMLAVLLVVSVAGAAAVVWVLR